VVVILVAAAADSMLLSLVPRNHNLDALDQRLEHADVPPLMRFWPVWLRRLTNLDLPLGQVLAPWDYAALSGVERTVQQ
jgi:hypothetical protein